MKNKAITTILLTLCLWAGSAFAQGHTETLINSELANIRLSELIANKNKLIVVVESFSTPDVFFKSIDPYITNINSTTDPAVNLIVSENFLKTKVVEIIAKAENSAPPAIGSEIIFSMTSSGVYMFHEETPRRDGEFDPDAEDPTENDLNIEMFMPYMDNPDRIPGLEGMPGRWLLALTPINKNSYNTSAEGIFSDPKKITAYSFLYQKKLAPSGGIYTLERFSDAVQILNSPGTAAATVSRAKKNKATSKETVALSNFILKSELGELKKITAAKRKGNISKINPKTDLGKKITNKLQ